MVVLLVDLELEDSKELVVRVVRKTISTGKRLGSPGLWAKKLSICLLYPASTNATLP
jgi:hypothetical protein